MNQPGVVGYHVLTKPGDATGEVEAALKKAETSAHAAGLHRFFYVTQARQTVVMVDAPDAVLAVALRRAGGWQEPSEAD